nr:polyhedron envelope protein [Spodoptera littoralis nucleopolyhedrovirus]
MFAPSASKHPRAQVYRIDDLDEKLAFENYEPGDYPLIVPFLDPDSYTCKIEGDGYYRMRYVYENVDYDEDLYDKNKNPLIKQQAKVTSPIDRSTYYVYQVVEMYCDEPNRSIAFEFMLPYVVDDITYKLYCVHFNYSYYIRGQVEWTPNPYFLNVIHDNFLSKTFGTRIPKFLSQS